jgi:hypothetical protein
MPYNNTIHVAFGMSYIIPKKYNKDFLVDREAIRCTGIQMDMAKARKFVIKYEDFRIDPRKIDGFKIELPENARSMKGLFIK